MKYHNYIKGSLAVCLLPMVFACSKSKFSAVKPKPISSGTIASPRVSPTDNSTTTTNPSKTPTTPSVIAPQVGCDTYTETLQGYDSGAKGINLILDFDTSKSMENNRVATVEALISTYFNGLARKVPMSVAVITGHSDVSPDSVNYRGREKNFFYQQSNEPQVIHFKPGMSSKAYKRAKAALMHKITNMRVDNTSGVSDGGELLLNNLRNLLTPERIAWAKKEKALQEGYAVGLIFLSDENDICTPTDGMAGHKVDHNRYKVPVRNSNGDITGHQTLEAEEISKSQYCDGITSGDDLAIRAKSILAASGLNTVFSTGFLYTGETQIPKGEDEAGYGYIQFIEQMNQKSGPYAMFDLGEINGHHNEWANDKAAEMSRLTNLSADLYVRRSIRRGNQTINPNSLKEVTITVDGRRLNSSEYFVRGNQFYLTGCESNSTISINYCVNN